MIRAALNVHETRVQYGESCRALIENPAWENQEGLPQKQNPKKLWIRIGNGSQTSAHCWIEGQQIISSWSPT